MAQLTNLQLRNTGSGIGAYEAHNEGVSTGAAYADLLVIDNRNNRELLVTLVETGGAQSLHYKILASIKDGDIQPSNSDVSYQELRTETALAANGKTHELIVAGWKWIIVQVKNNSGSATVTGRARGTA